MVNFLRMVRENRAVFFVPLAPKELCIFAQKY